jgi:hypothetical protein
MIVWLDHLIFGNGYGLASPGLDTRFYWLVDKRTGKGDLYNLIAGGLGAQLRSRQWRHPRAGEERELCGRTFVPYGSVRSGPRVEVSWSWRALPHELEKANLALAELAREIGTGMYR